MQPDAEPQNASFDTGFFPQHVALLTVGENMMPMGYWTGLPTDREPIMYLSEKDVAALGEKWRYRR